MTRKELEAENRVLRGKLDALAAEIAQSHGPIGLSWLGSFVRQARADVKAARDKAANDCQPVPAAERRNRAFAAFL
jgi:hypothetical protein